MRSQLVIIVIIPPFMTGYRILKKKLFVYYAYLEGISLPLLLLLYFFSILRPFTLFFRIPCIPHGPPDLPAPQPLNSLEYLASPPPTPLFVFIIE